MRNLIYLLAVILAFAVSSCSKSSSRHDREISDAEDVMWSNADSALRMLEAIDPSELAADSSRAKYHYLVAYGHMRCNRSMIGDSLVSYAHGYYRGKDVIRDIRSGMAFAWYKFWVGDTPGAMAMLDSLAGLPNVPDSIMVQTLRTRVLLGAAEYQGRELVPLAKRLESLEIDSLRKIEAKYILTSSLFETQKQSYLIFNKIQYLKGDLG